MKLTKKQEKEIHKICREYAMVGQTSVFRNLANEIIEYLEEKL